MAENKIPPSLFLALRHLLADVLSVGRTRVALLANELEEEKIRFFRVLVNGFFALTSLVIAAVLLVVFVAVLFWENRLLVFGLSALLFVLLALGFAWRSRAGLDRDFVLFKTSLAELDADVTALRGRSDVKATDTVPKTGVTGLRDEDAG